MSAGSSDQDLGQGIQMLRNSNDSPEDINPCAPSSLSFGETEAPSDLLFNIPSVRDADVDGKKVLLRVDLNVPLNNDGSIADNSRILAALPTIRFLLERNAKVIIMTHLGRPKGFDEKYRVDVIAKDLERLLKIHVLKADSTVGEDAKLAVSKLNGDSVVLLENVRFNDGESSNDPDYAKTLASFGDLYVNDAFGVCHRKHASVFGIADHLDSYAGLLLEKEITNLGCLMTNAKQPVAIILGGSKVSDKLLVIDRFLDSVDQILTGGGMFCTFLKAMGYETGKSLMEPDKVDDCKRILERSKTSKAKLVLPVDVVIAKEMTADSETRVTPIDAIPSDWRVLDIGPKTAEMYQEIIAGAKTVFWNGPMGLYEVDPFSAGTIAVGEAVAANTGTTVIGGGDTDAALKKFGLEEHVTFISTGGGASLKFLEGTPMPGIEALRREQTSKDKV